MNATSLSFTDLYAYTREKWHIYSQRVTASLEVSKPKNHLLVLDGMRALACLAVLLEHSFGRVILPAIWKPSGKFSTLLAAALDFGESGVILFFLLSSFLLFLPFVKALLFDGQWPSISRFYIRRFFRILPGYYVAVVLIVFFFHPEFLHANHRVQLLQFFTFSMGFDVSNQLNTPFWTMAVEFQFYMLLPLIAWILSLVVRGGTLRWRLAKLVGCLLIMLGWGLISRWWGLFIQPSHASFLQHVLSLLKPYYYSDNGKYFETFAIGMMLAMLYVYTQNAPKGKILQMKLQRWSLSIFLVGLLILGFITVWRYNAKVDHSLFHQFSFVFGFLNTDANFTRPMFLQWQAIGYSLCYGLCMCALLYNSGRLKQPFEWPVFRWIGLFSFSLYMWHFSFLLVFLNILNTQFQGWGSEIKLIALVAWVFFIIFPISLTLYRWIEMPGMRLGEMIIQRIEKFKAQRSTDMSINVQVQEIVSPSPEDHMVRL